MAAQGVQVVLVQMVGRLFLHTKATSPQQLVVQEAPPIICQMVLQIMALVALVEAPLEVQGAWHQGMQGVVQAPMLQAVVGEVPAHQGPASAAVALAVLVGRGCPTPLRSQAPSRPMEAGAGEVETVAAAWVGRGVAAQEAPAPLQQLQGLPTQAGEEVVGQVANQVLRVALASSLSGGEPTMKQMLSAWQSQLGG
jgi:hypothetical protein